MRGTVLWSLVLLAGCAGGRGRNVVDHPWDRIDWDCESFTIAIGDAPTLEIENGRGRFEVRQRATRVGVTLDGDELPEERVVLEGDVVRVLDGAGETVLMLGRFRSPGGGCELVYSPDLDPAMVHRRYGFGVEALDERTGRQTGLDPADVLVVSKVCPGRAAAAGGLQRDDIILRMDDAAPVTARALARHVAHKASGSTLRLSLFRAGRETTIELETRDEATWPETAQVEAHLRQVIH